MSSSASRDHSQSPREAAAAALSQRQSLQERLRLREERKQQEELMKAFETPEEKRARRLAKKEAKERKKREKMGWGEEYMGYTNTDNPFGDNNLLGTFIWNKVSLGQPNWLLASPFCLFASYAVYSLFPKTLFSIPSAHAQVVPATDIVCPHEHTHQLPAASPLMTLSCSVKFQALHPQNQPNLRQDGRTVSASHAGWDSMVRTELHNAGVD